MKKIKILLSISQVSNCGVGYYRQWLPLKKLEEKGLIELKTIDFNWGDKEIEYPFKHKEQNGKFEGLDIDMRFREAYDWADLIYICRDENMMYLALHGGIKEFLRKEKKCKKPILVDVDDYVQFTRPHNPGYMSFHPGSAFNELNLTLFNIADGVTFSTEFLKDAYKKREH